MNIMAMWCKLNSSIHNQSLSSTYNNNLQGHGKSTTGKTIAEYCFTKPKYLFKKTKNGNYIKLLVIYLCQDLGELLRCSVWRMLPLPCLMVNIGTLRWKLQTQKLFAGNYGVVAMAESEGWRDSSPCFEWGRRSRLETTCKILTCMFNGKLVNWGERES